MEFTNSRGQPGKALRMRIKGNDDNSVRVVLWGKDESTLPKIILPGAKARLYGVRTKTGNQGIEIHGSDATIIEIEGKNEVEPLALRIMSISKNDTGSTIVSGIDAGKNSFNVTDLVNSFGTFQIGDVIECMPSKAYGNSITIDKDSFVRKIEDDKNIPTLLELRTKISDVMIGKDYFIEAIILKIPGRREVQTKTGESISLAEMYVEDDTGQIWIKGWRNQARLLDNFSIGEIISATGLTARSGLEGRVELFLTPFTTINKKN